MEKRVVAGGIVKKDNKYLLVQETKEICKGKWNIPAGRVEDGESVIEAAKREVFEETGCKVNITGVIEIKQREFNGIDVFVFLFDTELIDENITVDGKEISSVKWFTYEEILNMKDNLRSDGYFLNAIENKINNKVYPMDLISISK